ncbi:MAG: sodium-dependent transporter [Parabacteroides sp.]
MEKTTTKRATFGSKLGVILATVGCAVGLGNIWRFPYMVGSNGGAAFLLVYVICILLLGAPVMITEFFIGRHSKRNAAGAFKIMAPGTKWSFIGYNGVLGAFLILGFYSVVAGWTLEYITQAFSGSLSGKDAEAFTAEFAAFSSDVFRPIFWTAAFVVLTHVIIVCGVQKGIERASKVMMPLLFLILIALCIRSVTLPNAQVGLDFLFRPDFSKIDSSVILSAMGQAFFSLSIGMGCLITYASYFSKSTNLQTTALQVMSLDTLVAMLAGIMIFPAVFSFGIEPTAGPELVFITLPNVFAQMPWGNVWSLIFFLLLALAALTSTISLHEVSTAYLHEEYYLSRKQAALLVSLGVLILGTLSSLSMGLLKEYTVFGLNFFDLLDFVTAKIMLPLGGMLICLFVGTHVDKQVLKEELTNKGTVKFYLFNTYAFFMKYIAPIAIGIIFLNEIGLIDGMARFFLLQ